MAQFDWEMLLLHYSFDSAMLLKDKPGSTIQMV